jgi:gas vesicle protein
MKGFPSRFLPADSASRAARTAARWQARQLTVVRRRAQPAAVYIARLTITAVFAYLVAQQLPGGSPRDVLAPLTALLVAQATLYQTAGRAIRRVAAVTAGVLAAVLVAGYVAFSWWVLGLLIGGTLALGIMLRLGEEILEVPVSAMVIFSVSSHSAATTRIIETLVGATAGLAAGLVFAPLRVQPAREAAGELSSQMAALLSQMAHGLAEASDPQRAAEWLDRTRALRGEIERVDDALATAEESIRLNPRRLRFGNPAAGLRDGLGTLEHAATAMRVLARSVADSARLDSADSPVNDPQTRAQLAAVLAGLSAAVDTYGQLLAARPVPAAGAGPTAEPLTSRLGDHLDAAKRQQDQLARLLRTNPAERPEGWPLRGEILSHIDRLRSQLDLGRPPGPARARPPLKALRDRRRGSSDQEPQDTPPAAPEPERTGGSGPGRQPYK